MSPLVKPLIASLHVTLHVTLQSSLLGERERVYQEQRSGTDYRFKGGQQGGALAVALLAVHL
jgi:hypothetical protein